MKPEFKIISDLINENSQVLDVGCGNGFVGQYLKELGFQKISGIDCRKTKLETARSKKCYEDVRRLVFGLEDSTVPEEFQG